jgi:hypothetical protein
VFFYLSSVKTIDLFRQKQVFIASDSYEIEKMKKEKKILQTSFCTKS